ncbi:MAG: DUF1385 domain-containing protein [Sumerlaeia bacterium]
MDKPADGADFQDNPSGTPRMEMGGQALIEGVLMRSRTGYAAAVRRDDGQIVVRQVPYHTLAERIRLFKLPVIRGAVALIEMMAIGTRTLRWSADLFERALKRKEAREKGEAEGEGPEDHSTSALPSSVKDAFGQAGFLSMLAISLTIVILMMVVAPNFLTLLVGKLPFLAEWADAQGTLGFTEENHPILFNLIAGVFRAVILVIYMIAISLNPDIRRVFEYHGGEHKAVLALESGRPLSVENAQRHDTLHPRCGTTFIAVVVLVSIIVFALVAALLVAYLPGYPEWHWTARKGLTLALHVLALPLVAGLAFETMKLCARNSRFWLCRALLWPGFRFQRITTRPPDDSQVEVALVALLAALAISPDQSGPTERVVQGLHQMDGAPNPADELPRVRTA